MYVLARLYRLGFRVPGIPENIDAATDWLLQHADTPDDQMPGLHFGEAGVAVAIAEAIAAKIVEPGYWTEPYFREALSGPIDWPDLSHGAAGQGVAAMLCACLLERPDFADSARPCEQYLLACEDNGQWPLPEGVAGMTGRTYTGLAHGAAGIVYFLAEWARRSESTKALDAAVRGGRALLECGYANDGYRSIRFPVSDDDNSSWRWWCHGAPGIALAFLSLWKATGDDHFAGAVRACLRSHPLEVRNPNLSQCHGLSGLGEIYLEAYQAFGEQEWWQRASRIGQTIIALAREDSHGASWLVENPYTPTPDLMIGCGGVVHFLARLAIVEHFTTLSSAPPLMLEDPI
jgi:hypothetical protein